jgi:phosphodiesterase/alkaline phosphatase D-like protein
MTMRTGTAAALAVAALAALPAGAGAKGFSYGVTSSEVTSSSALVWTRADKAGKVKLVVSADKKFGNKGDKKKTLSAKAAADDVVQVTVRGLKAGHRYAYVFTSGKNRSAVGHFKTAPKASQAKTLRFAYSGDADAQKAVGASKPFYNTFQIYKQMAKEGNDFNVNFGDTIYSDTEVGSTVQGGTFVPAQPTARTVAAKWAKYKQNLKLKNLQTVRAATGMYNHWDDHEFINDFTPPENGTQIYNAGVTAFRSYMPVTYSQQKGIYRSFKWGKNAEVFFLDERSFRSPKADDACINPDTNAPDLAPTAPQRVRNTFAIVTPSLARPVPQSCLDAINNPNSTMLGPDQYARFTAAVKASTAKFKIVMNEVPIQQFYALPYDRWEGYAAERTKLLTFLKDNVKNVVFLTTDTHANLYNDARFSTFPEENNGGGPVDSGINEMVTGPVATMTFTKEINGAAGRNDAGDLVTAAFFKPPPPDGVGMKCASTDVFSYSEVKVTSSAVTITPKDINGKLVHEKGSGAPPCGPFTIAAK